MKSDSAPDGFAKVFLFNMANGKKSFLLYCDLIHTFQHLTKEQRSDIIMWILEYVNDKDPEPLPGLLQAVVEPIKQQLKRDLKKYETRAERARANGQKGGRPKKPKKPSGLIKNPDEPKKPDTVTVTDTVTDTDILLKKVPKKREIFKPPTIEEIKTHASDKEYVNFDSEVFFNFYDSKGWMVGKSKMKNWKSAMAGWYARNKNKSNGTNQKSTNLGTHRIGSDWSEKM